MLVSCFVSLTALPAVFEMPLGDCGLKAFLLRGVNGSGDLAADFYFLGEIDCLERLLSALLPGVNLPALKLL